MCYVQPSVGACVHAYMHMCAVGVGTYRTVDLSVNVCGICDERQVANSHDRKNRLATLQTVP